MARMIKRSVSAAVFLSCAGVSMAGVAVPSFFARRDYSGVYSEYVAVADTNGDGILDLIANQTGQIHVLFGNGNGTFRPGPTTNINWRAGLEFVATDVNGDGTVDLVVAGGPVGEVPPLGIGICLGNSDGTFKDTVFYQAGDDAAMGGKPVVGDFNGDGILDVAAEGSLGVWLFTGKGDGTFNPGVLAASLSTEGGGNLAAADFNGDNKLDLVVLLTYAGTNGAGEGFVVFLGNGNGTFQAPLAFSEPKRPIDVVVGPLTKGGPAGIALTSGSDAYLFFGNGTGGFAGPRVVNLPGLTGIAIGDVNGDGVPDLVSTGGYIALGEGNGTFAKPYSYPVDSANGSWNVVLADLRKNGLTDIVADGYDSVSVLLSRGKGKYEDGLWTAVSGGAGCGVTADFNGDGKPDLAVTTSTGVSILLGTGRESAPFSAGSTIAINGAACLVTGDLNGDGIPDLLVAVNGSPNALVTYLGNGNGTFTLKSTTPTPNSGGSVVLADFNHDGRLDFATSGNLLALGNGDGTFQTPAAFVLSPPSSGFSNIATGDINNDGWPDIVLTSSVFPPVNLYVLLNNQKGAFTQVPTNFGGETSQATLADLDGDGSLDLVLTGATGGAVLYIGDGQGGFTLKLALTDPIALPGPVMIADVNGDGILDIEQLESDTLQIYLGEGNATYATPFYIGTGPTPAGVLTANLHGQLSSAGLPDILVPDYSGGMMVLLNLTK